FRDDTDGIGQFEQGAYALANQSLIIDKAHGNHREVSIGSHASSEKPWPFSVTISSRPPNCERRSRIPLSPLPWRTWMAPRPSSRAWMASVWSSARSKESHRLRALAWRTALVM